MMIDDYTYMILGAQKYITTQIEKKMPEKILSSVWGTTDLNLGPDEYGLVIYRGKKKLVFRFTKNELIEDYGSTKWRTRLLRRVTEILRRMKT